MDDGIDKGVDKGVGQEAERNLTIAIGGMSCDGCVASVTRVLSRLQGVRVLKVAVGSVTIATAPQFLEADLTRAIEKAGFTPGPIQSA
jgi:copper chaperone CopZ